MRLKILVLLAMPLLLALSSCTKEEVAPKDPPYTNGTWMIHLFTDSGNDETSDYAGYDFVFASGGALTATKSGTTTTGTWSTRTDDGVKKMDINLVTTDANLLDLNNDWVIVSSSSTLLELADDNEVSGEVVHFMKK